MALKIRLARGGAKKRPYYRIVIADSASPRDGRFIEKVGTYNPLLPKDSDKRVILVEDRVRHWLSMGARPTDRVLRFLDAAGMMERAARNNPNKAKPGQKALDRIEEKREKEEAAKANISEKIEEIIVPTHDITEVKRGKRVQRKKKYFPGYVLIKSEMDNNIYHMIKNIKKVSGFLGSRGTPVPVSDNEIEKILGQIKDGVAQPKSSVDYSIGEKVQVIDGPFASFSGLVEEIDDDKSRLKVSVSIFGRPTPVDLEFNQVEKVS